MYIDKLALGIAIGCVLEFALLIALAIWSNWKNRKKGG